LHFKTAAVPGSSQISAGREFHTDGPVTEKSHVQSSPIYVTQFKTHSYTQNQQSASPVSVREKWMR